MVGTDFQGLEQRGFGFGQIFAGQINASFGKGSKSGGGIAGAQGRHPRQRGFRFILGQIQINKTGHRRHLTRNKGQHFLVRPPRLLHLPGLPQQGAETSVIFRIFRTQL